MSLAASEPLVLRARPLEPVPGTPPLAMTFGIPESEAALDAEFGPLMTPVAEMPDARRFAAQVTRAALDAMAGNRPMTTLIRWLDVDVYQRLSRRVAIRLRRLGSAPRVREIVTINSAHACVVSVNAVEVTVVAREGKRYRAVALRLEGYDHRWRVTAIEMG